MTGGLFGDMHGTPRNDLILPLPEPHNRQTLLGIREVIEPSFYQTGDHFQSLAIINLGKRRLVEDSITTQRDIMRIVYQQLEPVDIPALLYGVGLQSGTIEFGYAGIKPHHSAAIGTKGISFHDYLCVLINGAYQHMDDNSIPYPIEIKGRSMSTPSITRLSSIDRRITKELQSRMNQRVLYNNKTDSRVYRVAKHGPSDEKVSEQTEKFGKSLEVYLGARTYDPVVDQKRRIRINTR